MTGGMVMEDEKTRQTSDENTPKLMHQEVVTVWSDFANTVAPQAEVALDSAIDSDLLKNIPICGQIISIVKFSFDVRDVLLARKVKEFLNGMTSQQIEKLKKKLSSDERYRERFTEKVVLLLDRQSDMEKAGILAKVVSAYADDVIDRGTMERLFDAVDRLFVQDLQVLTAFYNLSDDILDFIEQHFDSLQGLALSGLVAMNVQDGSQWQYAGDRFNPNRLGETLVTILQDQQRPLREYRGLGKIRR
jgi:D-ribose pyranose/furanose isomerase RbsD